MVRLLMVFMVSMSWVSGSSSVVLLRLLSRVMI